MAEEALAVVDGHVVLSDGGVAHARWLRERCGSAAAAAAGRQPRRSLAHPARRAAAAARVLTALRVGDALRVTFDDGHVAELSAARVAGERAAFARAGALMAPPVRAAPAPRAWRAGSLELHRVEHAAMALHRPAARAGAAARAARAELLAALMRSGVALVRGVPGISGEVERFARALVGQVRETHWGVVFDVRSTPDARDAGGRVDQAFSADAIDFHVDNPYRTPVPEFQLLHCLAWDQLVGSATDGANRLVDGLACAEHLRATDPDAFDLVGRTPCKWENDAPMTALQPVLQLSADGVRVERVFFSAKSGGFAPPLPVAELDAFYAALDKLVALFESDEFVVTNRLAPGDLIIFQNTRVLHARNGFSEAVSRHLQGLYIDLDAIERTHAELTDPAAADGDAGASTWRSLTECTGDDVREMGRLYAEDQKANRVHRVLDMLRAQRGKHAELGAPVDLFEHGLQTATRAHAAGESVDVVVAALFHDIGELFVPENHGDVPAAILAPYVEPAVTTMLRQHEIFQAQFYGSAIGLDVSTDQLRAMPEYELTQRFCEQYDQTSFDASFESKPIAFFQPMVEEVFNRQPYWHTPDHPKKGLVTGQ